MSYQAALEAAPWGPEFKKAKLSGHEFNVKPLTERWLEGDKLVATGRISHCKGWGQPDDQGDYRIVIRKHEVLEASIKWQEHHLWSVLIGIGAGAGVALLAVFCPPAGAALATTPALLEQGTHEVEHLLADGYDVAGKNFIALLAVALAEKYGQSPEWAPVRRPPPNALVAGHISDTPKPIYIGRAKHNGNLHPGKVAFYRDAWHCFIGNGGVEQEYDTYEVFLPIL